MTNIFGLSKAHTITSNIEGFKELTIKKFSDGEIKVEIDNTVRNSTVYVIGSLRSSDDIMELMMAGDAIKRASADKIIAVIPYMSYMRQDRKDKPRTAIGAKVIANMIELYYDQLITIDLHATQIEGFFNIPVTHIECTNLFASHIRKNYDLDNLVIVSPDVGGAKRAKKLANILGISLAIINKERKMANIVDSMSLMGDVTGKNVMLFDDMVDTAGSLCKAADLLIENGAKEVYATITHGVLSGDAHKRIKNSIIKHLNVTDTINIKDNEKINVISCTDIIQTTIDTIEHNESVDKTLKVHYTRN